VSKQMLKSFFGWLRTLTTMASGVAASSLSSRTFVFVITIAAAPSINGTSGIVARY